MLMVVIPDSTLVTGLSSPITIFFLNIIGQQGSGKSCVMMVANYCSWIEKRIMLLLLSTNKHPLKTSIKIPVKHHPKPPQYGGSI